MKKIIENLKNIMRNKYLWAFIIPLILNILVFSILGLYPFGDNMHIRSDAYQQYIRFLEFMKRIVYEGDFSQLLYSFSNGFGHGGMLYLAYYLLSPFNILVILLPFLNIEVVFMIIIMLKISCLGLSFYYFLEKFEFNIGKAGYIFSTSYSFISFVVIYNINIMWLDSIILLPILLVSLKEMFETNKILKFTLLMWALYISNFYMAFMVCIFIVLILLLALVFNRDVRIDLKRKVKLFIMSIGISVLLFGLIMVPVISELIEFYSGDNPYELFEKLTLSKVIAKLFVFKYDTFFSMPYLMLMAPYSYFGLFPLILSIIYLLFAENDANKKILISISVIIIVSFLIPELNIIWHGFDAPTGFDYRYSFILSFIGLVMASKGFKYICENRIAKKEIIKLIIIILILFILAIKEMSLIILLANAFFVLFYICIIVLSGNLNAWKEKISMVVILEIVLNAVLLNMMLGAQMGVMTKDEYFEYKSSIEIKKVVDSYTDSNYRVLIERSLLPSINVPIEIGYNGVSSFNSSINFNFIEELSKLGLYRSGELVYTLDSNYLTDAILSVKYVVSNRELGLYKKIDELTIMNEKAYIYENPYVMPIGFTSIEGVDSLDVSDIEGNILKVASSISGKDYSRDVLYKKYSPKKVLIDNKEILPDDNGEYILNKNMIKSHSVLRIEYPEAVDLAVRVGKHGDTEGQRLLIKKGKSFNVSYRNYSSYYNNIGKKESFIEFDIYSNDWEVKSINTVNVGKLEGLEINEDYLKGILEDIKSNDSTSIEYWKNGYIRLTVDNKEDNILFTTIPYAESWKAKINGKEVELDSSELGTLSLELEKGINNIELKYIPNGLKTGLFMTLVGVLVLLFRIKKFE